MNIVEEVAHHHLDIAFTERELCTLCVLAFQSSAVYARVRQTVVPAGPWQIVVDGMPWTINMYQHGNDTPMHCLGGYPGGFADVARALDAPDTSWWINQSKVRVWAETNIFGLRVCYSHVPDALELWKSGRRIGW